MGAALRLARPDAHRDALGRRTSRALDPPPALVRARRVSAATTVAVAVMAKAPDAGGVKTRLCPPLSSREAAALARGFLRDRIAQVRALTDARPVIAYTPASERERFERLAPDFAL